MRIQEPRREWGYLNYPHASEKKKRPKKVKFDVALVATGGTSGDESWRWGRLTRFVIFQLMSGGRSRRTYRPKERQIRERGREADGDTSFRESLISGAVETEEGGEEKNPPATVWRSFQKAVDNLSNAVKNRQKESKSMPGTLGAKTSAYQKEL